MQQTVKVAKDHAPSLSCDGHISVTVCADSGMLASDYCPNVTTAYVLDLSQPNVSSGWGYKRELLTTPLSAHSVAAGLPLATMRVGVS